MTKLKMALFVATALSDRNEIANLGQDDEVTFAWPGGPLGLGMFYLHSLLVEPFRLRTQYFILGDGFEKNQI